MSVSFTDDFTDAPANNLARAAEAVARSGQPSVSVVTRVILSAPPAKIWEALMFYEQIERRPPLLLRLLLPVPIRTEGRKSQVGDIVKCHYERGYLIKRVTRVIRGRNYDFEVIEQNLTLGGGIRLSGGGYTLCGLPGEGTEVGLETRYASPNRPRWLWERLETAVCHSFHRYILGMMRSNLELH